MQTKMILGSWLILCTSFAQSQTFAEWFKQNKTQVRYSLQQIEALQAYIVTLEKGYGIVQDGLHAIQDIKKGDFDLHSDYFHSLSTVNASVKNDDQVTACRRLQKLVLQQVPQVKNAALQLSTTEQSYIYSVLTVLMAGCDTDLTELLVLVSDGNYQLQDQERLRRVAFIHADLQDRYEFIRHFGAQVAVLVIQRRKERPDAGQLQKMLDIK